ncbi:MAG: helix-turn-helix transcriptional regulator [Clostridia bacterium]|nr:helix-turn-helix transcriptional regulator [Clostridia bacterium]
MKLEEKIFTLRKKNGLSQDDLAQQLGVTRQAVYKWESGNALPELDKIKALAKIFSVSFDYLLNDTIEEYDTNKDNEKISYRPIYLLGDKQNLMQGDIDHGYIKERDSRNTMSKVIFSKRKSLAESYMKKAGATEISFFSEEETLAYFYDSNQQTIGIYYGNGIQFVCPIENLVSISLNGGATNVVNSRSTMLGISNAGIGIGSMPTVSVHGSYPIDLTIMFHDGDIIKDFSFKIMTAVTYLYFEQSRSNVEIINSILRNRVADRIGKIKTKIEALICNSAVLVG